MHTYTTNDGTRFLYNSDLSGDVYISSPDWQAAKDSAVPGWRVVDACIHDTGVRWDMPATRGAVREFVACAFVRPALIEKVEEMKTGELLLRMVTEGIALPAPP